MTLAMDAPVDREYAALVRKFPPRPIHNELEYDVMAAVMYTICAKEKLSPAETDYLDALSLFIKAYDERQHPDMELSLLERLNWLVNEAGMSASDLGRLLGNRGLGSLLLTGKRGLSKAHIRKLAEHFKLDEGYFF